jgi:hypothetical protein
VLDLLIRRGRKLCFIEGFDVEHNIVALNPNAALTSDITDADW